MHVTPKCKGVNEHWQAGSHVDGLSAPYQYDADKFLCFQKKETILEVQRLSIKMYSMSASEHIVEGKTVFWYRKQLGLLW